jgi:hypothetical protein
MARGAVAARHFAARKPVVDVLPMIGRNIAGSIPDASIASTRRNTCTTFGQP